MKGMQVVNFLKVRNLVNRRDGNIFSPNYLFFLNFSKNVSVMANELRSGNIFLHNDRYCEVTDYRQIKHGRLASTNMINYIDLSTLKSNSVKFACQAKVEKIEPEKVNVKIQYTDKQKNIVICLDENYAELEIPLNLFGVSEEYLDPGLQLNVYKHEDKIIKVNLPSSLLSTLRKK